MPNPQERGQVVKITLQKTTNQIQINGKLSESFETKSGLRQGDALSTLLFNLALEKIVRGIQVNPGGSIVNRSILYLAYADDLVLIARSLSGLKETS